MFLPVVANWRKKRSRCCGGILWTTSRSIGDALTCSYYWSETNLCCWSSYNSTWAPRTIIFLANHVQKPIWGSNLELKTQNLLLKMSKIFKKSIFCFWLYFGSMISKDYLDLSKRSKSAKISSYQVLFELKCSRGGILLSWSV